LKKETNSYATDVTVVGGAGRDGIALVLAMTERGLTINVNDSDIQAIEQLEKGQMPYVEVGAARLLKDALENKRLVFSKSPNRISPRGPVIRAPRIMTILSLARLPLRRDGHFRC
jgi:UDP-N-acetyl-D-mannosaminuronate dehydrogenase